MKRCRNLVLISVVAGAAGGVAAPAAMAQSGGFEPVEQYVADRNALSTSLRRLHLGLSRPTGFQDVFHVPGEPGKFMRVHGGVHAVFSQSLYDFNDDNEIEAVIPPNTVFRIGPRVAPGGAAMSLMVGHPGLVRLSDEDLAGEPDPHRVVAEGFGRGAVLPRTRLRSITSSRDASPTMLAARQQDEIDDPPATLDEPGTIIGDEQYRRKRLQELMQQAAGAE